MEDRTFLRNVVLEDVKDIVAGLPVVDDHWKMVLSGNLKVPEEHLHLNALVLAVFAVIKTGLPYGHDAVQLQELEDLGVPVKKTVAALCGRHTYRMVNILGALEVLVDDLEVRQAVAD